MKDRFTIEILDEKNWLIEDHKTGMNANPIDGTTNVLKGLISLLNRFNNNIEELQERIDNQYMQLDNLWSLIEAKDWETLTAMDEETKKNEELIQLYGG